MKELLFPCFDLDLKHVQKAIKTKQQRCRLRGRCEQTSGCVDTQHTVPSVASHRAQFQNFVLQSMGPSRPAVCLTPDGGSTVHMLRGVFQQAVSAVVVLDVVEWDGLEAPPAQGQDQGVSRLQDAAVPAVLLQAHLHTSRSVLSVCLRLNSVDLMGGQSQTSHRWGAHYKKRPV